MDNFNLPEFVDNILNRHKDKHVDAAAIWKGIGRSLSIVKLVDNLDKAFTLPADNAKEDIKDMYLDATLIWKAIRDSLTIDKLIENGIVEVLKNLRKEYEKSPYFNQIFTDKSTKMITSD